MDSEDIAVEQEARSTDFVNSNNNEEEEDGVLIMADETEDAEWTASPVSPKAELVIELDDTNEDEDIDVVVDDQEDHVNRDEDNNKRDVVLDKLPRPVRELNCRMARSYLVKLLRVANGGQNPQYGRSDTCPPFWPNYYWPWTRLTDVHTKPIGMTEPLQYSEMMKLAIAKGYQYFGYDPDVYVDEKAEDPDASNSNFMRWHVDMSTGVPPKLPRPLSKLNCVQARTALSKLLRYQQGGSNPMYGSPETRPPWWPDDLIRWVDMVDLRGKPPYLPDQKTYTDVLRAAIDRSLRYHGLNPETYVDPDLNNDGSGSSSSSSLPGLKPLQSQSTFRLNKSLSKPPLRPILPKFTPLLPKLGSSHQSCSPMITVRTATPPSLSPPSPSPLSQPPRLPRPIKKLNCGGVRVALSKLLWYYNNHQPPNYGNPDSMPTWWPNHIMEWRSVKNLRHKFEGELRNSYTNCLRIALIRGYAHYGLDPNDYHNEAISDKHRLNGAKVSQNHGQRPLPSLRPFHNGTPKPMPPLKIMLGSSLKGNLGPNVPLKAKSSPLLDLVCEEKRRNQFSDLKLISKEGKSVNIHRAFLAASSVSRRWTIMQQLINDPSDVACIILPDVSFLCLQHLASILYSGRVFLKDMHETRELEQALKMLKNLGLMTKVNLSEQSDDESKEDALDVSFNGLQDIFDTLEADEEFDEDDSIEMDLSRPNSASSDSKPKHFVSVKFSSDLGQENMIHDTLALQQKEEEKSGEESDDDSDEVSETQSLVVKTNEDVKVKNTTKKKAQNTEEATEISFDVHDIKVEPDPESFVLVTTPQGSEGNSDNEADTESKKSKNEKVKTTETMTKRPVRKRKAPAAFAEFVSDLTFNFDDSSGKASRAKTSKNAADS